MEDATDYYTRTPCETQEETKGKATYGYTWYIFGERPPTIKIGM